MRALLAILFLGALWGSVHLFGESRYEKGVATEKERRDGIDAKKKGADDRELARLNALLADAKARLAEARASLTIQQKELENAKSINAGLQSDLVAGRRSLRTPVRPTTSICESAHPDGTTAGRLDHDAAVTAELDGQVAAGLAGLTGEGDASIRRLNACITAYRAVEKAINTTGEHTGGTKE